MAVRAKSEKAARPTFRKLPLGEVYRLIEPGPVVFVTTAQKRRGGEPVANVMTMTWHLMMEFEPPLIGCLLSGGNHSFAALDKTGECVIAIPARSLAQQVVQIGNSTGAEIDKFASFGLTRLPAERVGAPLIAECFANLECKVADRALVKRYNFWVLEVVQAWIDPRQKNPKTLHHQGNGKFAIDGQVIRLKSGKK